MRYITPEMIVDDRFGRKKRPIWDIAIISFRSLQSSTHLIQILNANPINDEILRGFEGAKDSLQAYEAVWGAKRIGIVPQCIWGGPQAAILVEEIACFGAKQIIGFGAAGGIVPHLAKGTQIVASSGIVSDGTSRAYTTQDEVRVSTSLLELVKDVAECQDVGIVSAKTGTVDAFYQETEDLMEVWRGQGVQAINMETAPMYAAAAFCGVESVWLGHIADRLLDCKWYSGTRSGEVTTTTIELVVGLIETLVEHS